MEQQPMDKETRKKMLVDNMAKQTGANMPAPPPMPPQPEQPQAGAEQPQGEQPQPEGEQPQEDPNAEQGVQAQQAGMTPEQMEQQQRDQQLQEALSYFGPRLAAQLMGGSDAANVTDKLLKDYENHRQNISDRDAERRRQEESEEERKRKEYRENERLRIAQDAEARKQAADEEQSKYRKQQQGLQQGNLFARLEELKLQKQRAGSLTEERDLRRKERNVQRSIRQVENFGKIPVVKKVQGQLANLDDMENILNDAPEIASGVIPFKIAKGIAGEVGNLTTDERKAAQISPSFLRNLERGGTKFLTGKLPEKDVKELNKVLNVLRQKQRGNLKKYADNYIKSRRQYVPQSELQEGIYGQYGLGEISASSPKGMPSDDELYNMSDEQLEALERQYGVK